VVDRKLREEVEANCTISSDVKVLRHLVDVAIKQSTKRK
jgi:hypothetical protein